MKVLVFTTRVPFIHGGAEELRDHLVLNLRERGVEAEAMSIPFTWDPAERLLEEMWISRTIEISNVDRVIALKFPAYLTPYPDKVIWLLHQYRQAYDLWDVGQSNIPRTSRGEEIREAIWRADALAFAEARAIFTNSPVTQKRLRNYNGIDSSVLPPPVNDPELFCGGPSDGYVFVGGRVGHAKRQELLIRALQYAPDVKMVIAGPPDSEAEGLELARLAAELGVEDRLVLDMRFLSRSELAHLLNHAGASAYIPFDEDSMGYVTMEAFQAAKPVVTATDSGGLLEIVRDQETGIVAEPTAEGLGEALRTIMADQLRARRLGGAGRQLLEDRGLTWPQTVEKLLA